MELIIKAWKPVEWDNLQIRLEEEIRALGERQDDGEIGRKTLVEESNKYRENTDKETRKVAVPLIKAFQKEVDRLTAVNKSTESSLIEICSRLTNIPDPLPILEQAPSWKTQAEKTNTAIEEANQLRSTISELHSEFSDLKNQDVTIRQLRDRIKQLESEKSTEVDQAVTETERRLLDEQAAGQFETNMRAEKLKAENQSLEKKVADLEQKMKEAQRRQDLTRQAAGQRETFQLEQIEILTRDLESANRRVATLEGDVSRLTTELADAMEKSKRGGLEDIAAFGGLMKEKDEQIARMKEEQKHLLFKIENDAKKTTALQGEMAKELEKQRVVIREFETKLADMGDYEAIKNELRLLREIEFGEAAEANEDAINKLGETVQSLDRLLAEKNRRLQNDNAQLRQTNHRQQEIIEEQAIELGELQTRTDEQQQLIAKLEKDLSVVGTKPAAAEPREDLSTLEVLEHMGNETIRPTDGSVVSILSAQRDRLRSKVSSLEEELVEAKTREKVQQTQIEKMTDDNVKLYGKIKFLQGYGNKGSVSVPVDAPNYSEQYEQRMDPFRSFKQSEKLRSTAKLQLHDRATLTIGKAIMGSSGARMLFFFYLVILHLLVFLVLYRYAFSDLVDQSFQKECVENFAQHMKEHHTGH